MHPTTLISTLLLLTISSVFASPLPVVNMCKPPNSPLLSIPTSPQIPSKIQTNSPTHPLTSPFPHKDGTNAANGATPEPGQAGILAAEQAAAAAAAQQAQQAACAAQPVDPNAPVQMIDGQAVTAAGQCSFMIAGGTGGKSLG